MEKLQIEVSNLNKHYGDKHVLKNIDLTMNTGIFGLLGRNGAGKTTLMKTLATLVQKSSGDIQICGIPIEDTKAVRRVIGYLPQDFAMYAQMSVYEALDYLAVLSGIGRNMRKVRIALLLEEVNLTNHARIKVKALSGGMRQRLGIAQALLHEPKVLIVDEPTAGLDPEERIRFRNLLAEFAAERIVILSTHIVGDIEATCEQIAILEQGQLLYTGTIRDLLQQAEGKVYRAEVQQAALAGIKDKHLITGMLTLGDRVHLRILADEKPLAAAAECEPNIEDAYILCMHESGMNVSSLGGGFSC